MASAVKKNKAEIKRVQELNKKYASRITVANNGYVSFNNGNYVAASKYYHQYLNIFTAIHNVETIYDLSPNHFDPKRDVAELLFISQIYWSLCRIYENVPKFSHDFNSSLNQFIKFTINQPYQNLNSDMLRKYMRKNKNKSSQIPAFTHALSKIFTESKKCYIATFAFGEEHRVTQDLRLFKVKIQKYNLGLLFIEKYYSHSSRLVSYLEDKPLISKITNALTRLPLFIFSKLVNKVNL